MKIMISLLFIIIIAILTLSETSQIDSANNDACAGRINGFYARTSTNCQQYYYCDKGRLVQNYTCEDNYSFSILKQKCTKEKIDHCLDVKCHQNEISDGKLYTFPGTKCKMYYQCVSNIRYDYICQNNMTFSTELQICVKNGICYEPICTGRVNGLYPDTTERCQRSFECSGGVIKSVKNCGNNQYFSTTIKECTDKVYLDEKCDTPQTTAISFSANDKVSNQCMGFPSDGAYVVPNTRCKEYFVCKNRVNLGTLSCTDNHIFNGQQCVPKSSSACRNECENREDGVYQDFETGCRAYTFCMNQRLVWKNTCPPNTLYNGVICEHVTKYSCPIQENILNICNNKKDGYHRNYSNCREYFYCNKGEIVLSGSCPKGQNWNGETCVEKAWFYCEGPEPWIGCLIKDGLFQDKSIGSRCRDYYYCLNGNRTKYSCPPTEVFNGEICVRRDKYECPMNENNPCETKDDGYYHEDNSNCRSYYFCSGGHKNSFICPANKIFNGESCVEKSFYQCPYYSNDCFNKSDGYHYDVKSGCKKYYYCSSNEKIISFSCEVDKIFNGHRCVASSEFKCITGENLCWNKTGFYTVPDSECKKFLECKDGKKVDEFECPENMVFNNNNQCVWKNCTNQLPKKCKKDGFFIDFDSKCKKYHFCLDGSITVLECSDGKLFNGQICVDEHSFTCEDNCDRYQNCENFL